jgi:type III restriction enzyme
MALVEEAKTGQRELPLFEATAEREAQELFAQVLREAGVSHLSAAIEPSARQAVQLLDHAVRVGMLEYAHAFQPLLRPLDEYAIRILEQRLSPVLPGSVDERREYFKPYLGDVDKGWRARLERNGRYLEQNLVYGRSIQKLGTLLFCLDYATNCPCEAAGVWRDVAGVFSASETRDLYPDLKVVNDFRNTRVAHIEQPLQNAEEARQAMGDWVRCLSKMSDIVGQ